MILLDTLESFCEIRAVLNSSIDSDFGRRVDITTDSLDGHFRTHIGAPDTAKIDKEQLLRRQAIQSRKDHVLIGILLQRLAHGSESNMDTAIVSQVFTESHLNSKVKLGYKDDNRHSNIPFH